MPKIGYKMSDEHKTKISLALKGKMPKFIPDNNGRERPDMVGENHWLWKKDSVNYFALHHWVNRWLGKPKECVYCGEEFKRLNWASISHKAKRDLEDYIPLCVRCHREYDRKGVGLYGNI